MVGRQEDIGTESHSFVTKVAQSRFGTQTNTISLYVVPEPYFILP